MLVVDLCDKRTIDNLRPLYERVRILSGFENDSFPCILVGNKVDLCVDNSDDDNVDNEIEGYKKRQITFEDMNKWAKECRLQNYDDNDNSKHYHNDQNADIHVFEISAKTKSYVMKAFEKLVGMFVERLSYIFTHFKYHISF